MANRYTQLTLKERYIIELLIWDKSNNQIALKPGRAKSTISREIKRNSKSKRRLSTSLISLDMRMGISSQKERLRLKKNRNY